MDFEGKCIQFLGETSGTSKTGNLWKKKEWVVETFGNFPRKVKIQAFGERSDSMNIEPGRDYIFSVDLDSREFNGKWYTDVSVFRVQDRGSQPMGAPASDPYGNGGYQQPSQPNQFGTPGYGQTSPFTPSANEADEDLPF